MGKRGGGGGIRVTKRGGGVRVGEINLMGQSGGVVERWCAGSVRVATGEGATSMAEGEERENFTGRGRRDKIR